MTNVHGAEPWKNARLLSRDSWSLPSLTEEDNLEEGAPRCSLTGTAAGLWAKELGGG